MRPTVIVLAAGRSTRYGRANKLLADLGGQPLLARTLRAASGAGRVLVVSGHDRASVETLVAAAGFETVHNPRYAEGMGTSIAAGAKASPDSPGWLIWPGDLPFVRAESVAAIVGHATADRPVVPLCDGRRGHPVWFPPSYSERLQGLAGDRGARELTSAAIFVETGDPGILRDVDTPDDREALSRTAAR